MDLKALNKEVNELCIRVGNWIAEEQHRLSDHDIGTKGLHDYVTYVDKRSEEMLVKGLGALLPESGFLVEEQTVEDKRKPYTWVVDPLDGTTNFIHGLPVFSVSIALMKGSEVVMGTVFEPVSGECFHAAKGGPALLNGREIRVSATARLDDSMLATGFPYSDFSRQEEYLALLGRLMRGCRGIRRFGSAAVDLAWVASGRFDGFWEYGLKPWDVAAGSFILERAGGICSDFSGGKNHISGGEIVCGNPAVYRELANLVRKYF
jgi:myo-inositol-1(or 4)-monophosphatase